MQKAEKVETQRAACIILDTSEKRMDKDEVVKLLKRAEETALKKEEKEERKSEFYEQVKRERAEIGKEREEGEKAYQSHAKEGGEGGESANKEVEKEEKESEKKEEEEDGEIREEQWFIKVKQLQKGGWVITCKSDAHAVALKKAIKQSPEQQSKKREEKVKVKIPSSVAKNSTKLFLTGFQSRYRTESDLINAMQQQHAAVVDAFIFKEGKSAIISISNSEKTERWKQNVTQTELEMIDTNTNEMYVIMIRKYEESMKCFKCLKYGHRSRECKEGVRCAKCGGGDT